jgi:hypothetical protein
MKYLNSPFFYMSIFLFASVSVQAKDHKNKLHEMGNPIKQAVKSGKESGDKGWGKWRAAQQQQHGHHGRVEHKNDAKDWDWDNIDELEHEIEIRVMEFELERIEQEHEFERLKWEQQMERMQHDFDRERKEWTIHDMQLHARMELMKKEMGNHLRSGTRPPQGTSPRQPHDRGPKNEMHRDINQGRLRPHLQHNNKQAPKKSQCQINSEKQPDQKKGCKKNGSASSKGSCKNKKKSGKAKCKKECSSKKGK